MMFLGVFRFENLFINNNEIKTINKPYSIVKMSARGGGYGCFFNFDNGVYILENTMNVFSTTKDENNKINIYRVDENNFAIQNLKGAAINFRIIYFTSGT